MSLHEPAGGILDTHVTWQDVESEMQNALKTSATFGGNKKVTSISDLKGFMSRIALIEPDWINKKDGEKLPEKFVVKMSSQLAMMNMTKMMDFAHEDFWSDGKLENMAAITRMLHNREVSAYKLLTKEKNPKIPLTRIYASQAFDDQNQLKGYIISEYIPNLMHMAMHESIPYQDLIPVVKGVAAFSAIGEKLDREELKFAGGSDFLEMIFGQMFDEKAQKQTNDMMRKAFPEEYKDKLEQMIQMYEDYYMNSKMMSKYKDISEFLGYRDVLTHTDLWGSNLLCTRENEKVSLKAIIDWQTVSFTTPAQDVGRLFVACLSKKDRREKLEELLELYYNSFIEELDDKPAPYTLQQLKNSYNLLFPMMVMMVLPGIAPILDHSDIPEEYREIVRKSATDKMIGLLEDVLEVHESNMEKFPDFLQF